MAQPDRLADLDRSPASLEDKSARQRPGRHRHRVVASQDDGLGMINSRRHGRPLLPSVVFDQIPEFRDQRHSARGVPTTGLDRSAAMARRALSLQGVNGQCSGLPGAWKAAERTAGLAREPAGIPTRNRRWFSREDRG